MRWVTLTVAILAMTGFGAGETDAVLLGAVHTVDGTGIADVAVYGADTAISTTDSAGRFSVRVPRSTPVLGFVKSGFLSFRYPMLQLRADTFVVAVELRSDPPSERSYIPGRRILPLLCVLPDAGRLIVRNSCPADEHPASAYARRIMKHAPWNPYFGTAADMGGVVIYTRY